MCGPRQHREKIEALLLWGMTRGPCRQSTDESRLAEFGLVLLREQFADLCSDKCMQERAATFAKNLVRQRSAATAPAVVSESGEQRADLQQ
jgi:hypothetical protein